MTGTPKSVKRVTKSTSPTTAPLFSIGDLVKIRGFGKVLAQSEIGLGIIAKGPYSYKSVESYHDLVYFEWWCYDVLIGSELVRMMPENFLLEVDIDEN
tara:strand:+ start:198 stop:491 length:294 start_codon:yes stop_codon:yes gene_type:complete